MSHGHVILLDEIGRRGQLSVTSINDLMQHPGPATALEELRQLLLAQGKTRLGVCEGNVAFLSPCQNGYWIELDPSRPNADGILVHEALHGILLEEKYPIAISHRVVESQDKTNEILWAFTNLIHHIEIFRRMKEQYEVDVEAYFQHRADEIRPRIEKRVAADDSLFATLHMDVLVLFDTFYMGKHGAELQARYRKLAERPVDVCQSIHEAVLPVGCQTADDAIRSARIFQEKMAGFMRRFGVGQEFTEFWESINYQTIHERPNLPPCPAWVPTIGNHAKEGWWSKFKRGCCGS